MQCVCALGIGQISGHWVQSFVHEVIGAMATRPTGPWYANAKKPKATVKGSIGKAMIFNIFPFNF